MNIPPAELEKITAAAKNLRFNAASEVEKTHRWFSYLLDGYAFLDASLEHEVSQLPKVTACKKGCGSCCSQPIPVLPAEVIGIHIFLEKIAPPSLSQAIRSKPMDEKGPCIFLKSGSCQIYPVRPMSCRRYLVLGESCTPGEDPIQSRPDDVLAPSINYFFYALHLTFPMYKALDMAPKESKESSMQFFLSKTAILQDISWAHPQSQS